MQITYLIGNGFDLAMGLKTSYRDFVTVYKELQSSKKCISDFKARIKTDMDTWSYGEITFGKYTSLYNSYNFMDFCTCYEDFLLELSSYLSKQELLCSTPISEENIIKVFRNALLNLYVEVQPINPGFNAMFQKNPSQTRKYSFVNFNYTRVFDKCLFLLGEPNTTIQTRELNGRKYHDTIGSVIHVHGTLDEFMVIGVNDESQVENKSILRHEEVRKRIIKPEIDEVTYTHKGAKCDAIIKSSSVIILFGMSIGQTDRIWWESIGDWLFCDTRRLLVIYTYIPSYTIRIPGSYNDARKGTQNLFLRNTNIHPNNYEGVRPRIQVVANYNLFGCRLFDLSSP